MAAAVISGFIQYPGVAFGPRKINSPTSPSGVSIAVLVHHRSRNAGHIDADGTGFAHAKSGLAVTSPVDSVNP